MKRVMYLRHLFRKNLHAIFFLTAFIFGSFLSYGQTTVTIGSGTSTSYSLPVVSNYGYNYSQQIVLQSEIGLAGDITKIRFYMVGGISLSSSNDWTIYLGHSTKSTFTSTTDWELFANLTQVYTGTIDATPAAGWYEITFDTPFAYNNTDNLVVAIDENTANFNGSTNYIRTWTTPVSNRSIYYRNDVTNPDPASPPTASGRYSYINQMQFEILQPPCTGTPDPGNTVTSSTPVCVGGSFDLSLQNLLLGEGITYQWQSSPDMVSWSDIGTGLNTLSTTTAASTYYQCVVTCTNSSETATSTPVLVDATVSALPYSEEFATTTTPSCWTTSGWSIGSTRGVTGNPGNNIYKNLYSAAATGTFTSGGIGSVEAGTNLVFDYKIANYSSPYAPPVAGSGNFIVSVSTDGGNTYTDLETVVNDGVAGWRTKNYDLSAYAGENVKIRFTGNWVSGDYDIAFDNIELRQLSSENDILTFSIPEQNLTPVAIDNINHTVAVEVLYGTDLSSLTPAITISADATINPLSGEAQDFTNPFNYTVTAENSSIQIWTVTVTAALTQSSEKNILTFSIPQQTGPATIGTNTIDTEVLWNTDLSSLTPTFTTSAFSSVNPLSGVAQDFTSPVTYTVTAEDASTKDYTVTVNLQPTPAGATCANAIPYTNINDPEIVTDIDSVSRELWFTVTLDQTYVDVAFSTCASVYDTKLYIYDACEGTQLAYDDDSPDSYCSVDHNQSLIEFTDLAAGTYYVRVTPYSGSTDISDPTTGLIVTGSNCATPNSVNASNITAITADISWTPVTDETTWNLKVSSTSIDPTTDAADIFDGAVSTSPLSPISGLTELTDYYVYVMASCGSDWTAEYTFTTIASCPAPIALSATASAYNADLSWNPLTGTAWNLKVSTVVIDPATEAGDIYDAAATNPINIPGLNPVTTYYYYVQTDCGAGETSLWSAQGSFTTTCGIYTVPFNQGFTSYLPQCWSEFTGILADPTTTSGTTSAWYGDGFANSGSTGAAGINIYGTGRKEWLSSPSIDLGDGSTPYVLTFDLALTAYASTGSAGTTGTDDKFAVVISTDNGATWSSANTLRLWDNAGSTYVYNNIATAGENVMIDLSAYTGVVKIGFYGESTSSNADNDLFIDNVAIRQLSSENDILTFSFTEQTGPATIDAVNHTVDIEVANGTDLSSLTPAITVSAYATINPLSGVAQDFTNPFNYTVTAEDLTDQIWTVNVTAAITQSSEKDILTFSIPEETGAAIIGTNTVDVEVAWTADLSNLTPAITTSALSTINPLSGVVNDFTSPVTYTVTAEDASTKEYTVTVTQEATPAGATCAAAIDYGTINDPEITSTMSVYETVWYTFTTTQPYANVDIHTCGSGFDTKIAVFSDCADVTTIPESGTPTGNMGYNDDDNIGYCAVDNNQSLLQYSVLPAGTYYVVVWPFSATTTLGDYALEIIGDTDACLVPTNLSLTDLQQAEITLTWETGFTETEWNLIYGAAGFDPATEGTLLTNVTYPYNLPGLTEATEYDVYVQAICSGPSTSEWSSVLNFTTLAACPAPTDLVINNTDVDAELSWNAWGTTAWNLKVSTTVIDPATGTGDVFDGPIGTNPYTIGSLTPNTTYYYYLQADCGAGETSLWSAQGSFTTECAALSAFNQNFDGVTTPALPSCWSKYLSPSYSYETVNTYTTAPYSTPNCVQLYSSGATAATDAPMLISPQILNLNSGTSQLRFYAKGASTNTSVIVGTMSDPLNSASFTPLQTVTGLSTSVWNEYTISLATYAGTDEYIAFRHPLTTTYSYIYIDNVVLEPIPSCQVPTYLTYSNLTTSSATISWTASPSDPANGYDYYVSTSSTAPDETTVPTGSVAAGITTADLSLLSENTTYYFWVRANCDGTDYSTWAGYESFFTGYCTPTATNTGTYISNFVTTGGESNISNNSGAFATDGYIDYYPSMFASHYATGVINFSTTIVGGTAGIAIYIDWNNDMDFSDAGERVYTSNAYQGTGTTSSSFTVPSDAVIGDYRMRVVTDYNSTNPASCSFAYGRGEAEDYKFTVVPLPACPTPTSLFADNISTNAANLNWTQLGSATAWNLKASTTPIDPAVEDGDFGIIPTTTNPFTTPAVLSENTTYYWYVQADCGGGSTSEWSLQGEFTTLCEAITTIPFNETFNSDSPTESCWTVLNENGDGDAWDMNYTSNPYEGDQVAMIYTDYNAGANNDYLVSPGITLTGSETLTYQYRVQSSGEPNDFEVLLSTTGIAPADFTTVLLPNASYSNTTYAMQTIDLSSYTGTVYIAWHVINGGLDGWRIYIDDVTIRETSDENDILTFSFAEQTGPATIDYFNHTIDIEVAMGTDPNGIVPTFTISDYATVDYASGDPQDFSAPFIYTVASESSIYQAWTVNVTIATTQSSANDILTFTLPTETGPANINAANHTVDIEVAWNTALTSLTPAITISTLATINPLSGTAQDFSAPFTYTVTAEDATPQDWIVTVTNASVPAGANCANAIDYGTVNDPQVSGVMTSYSEVWYTFTTTDTYEEVDIHSCGSSFDTKIAIFNDCGDVVSLPEYNVSPTGSIGFNDDSDNSYCAVDNNQSLVEFATLDPGTYYVVLYPYSLATVTSDWALEIIGTVVVVPQIDVIDLNSDVADVEVCQGVAAGTVIGLLAQQITITDTDLNEYNVFLSWTIDSYDANVPGDYNATGTFTLPSGVDQTDPVTPLEVYATVTVLAPPAVTCPGNFEVTDINTVALTGESPVGGIFSGTGVTAGEFSADGLENGDYMLTYTYTDPTTMCSNYCDFTVTVNIPLPVIDVIDVSNDVQDVAVCLGAVEAEALALLASEITISDDDANEYVVSVTWAIDAFDGNTAADYNATGTFELPATVAQTDPETTLEVYAVVTVNDLPVVTCPDNFSVTSEGAVTITGATPDGGTFSGTGITGNNFDPATLANGDYIITYSYTDAVTGCTNSCDFTITVDIDNSINVSESAAVSIYPNPNNGMFKLNFSNVNGNVNYQIYDTKGSILVDENILTNGNTVKEVSLNLVPGVYYVKLITAGQTLVEKLVIE